MSTITLDYDFLINDLISNSTFEIVTLEDPTIFKRRLSQRKSRKGVEGKLDFSVTELTTEQKADWGINDPSVKVNKIVVVLFPSKKKAKEVAVLHKPNSGF
ncbi:hypothetical protein 20Aug470_00045 [Pseudomonas phage 20Aug470]|nr:hypothetical protein 20Aug470_00045 [Pseudomonas phage 20Aug470]